MLISSLPAGKLDYSLKAAGHFELNLTQKTAIRILQHLTLKLLFWLCRTT